MPGACNAVSMLRQLPCGAQCDTINGQSLGQYERIVLCAEITCYI